MISIKNHPHLYLHHNHPLFLRRLSTLRMLHIHQYLPWTSSSHIVSSICTYEPWNKRYHTFKVQSPKATPPFVDDDEVKDSILFPELPQFIGKQKQRNVHIPPHKQPPQQRLPMTPTLRQSDTVLIDRSKPYCTPSQLEIPDEDKQSKDQIIIAFNTFLANISECNNQKDEVILIGDDDVKPNRKRKKKRQCTNACYNPIDICGDGNSCNGSKKRRNGTCQRNIAKGVRRFR
eukprot:683746_1